MLHKNMLPVDMHSIIAYTAATVVGLDSISVVEGQDEGKIAFVEDVQELYFLVTVTPLLWKPVAGTEAILSHLDLTDIGTNSHAAIDEFIVAASADIEALSAQVEALSNEALNINSVTIGNAVATSFTVTHSLGNRNLVVSVAEVASDYEVVYPEIKYTSTTTITVIFATPPSANQYRVNIIGLAS